MAITKITRDALNTGIDDNSDATAITIDSNERVGIGATSVDQLLHLETSTNTRQKIETTNSGAVAGLQLTNTAVTAEIGLETSSDAGGGAYGNSIGGSSLHILNNNNSGIVMDTSGRVTTPSQPSFFVNASPSLNGDTFHSFGTIQRNQGGHYNNSNGRFTAPVTGLYLFMASIWPSSGMNTTATYLVLKRNGHEMYGAHGVTNRQSITFTALVNMTTNDYVDLRRFGGWSRQSSTPRNFFGGYLVG